MILSNPDFSCSSVKDAINKERITFWSRMIKKKGAAGYAIIEDEARIMDKAVVEGCTVIRQQAKVVDNAYIEGNSFVTGHSVIGGNTNLEGKNHISGNSIISTAEFTVLKDIAVGRDADIRSHADVFVITHIGPQAENLTVYRNAYTNTDICLNYTFSENVTLDLTPEEFVEHICQKSEWQPYMDEMQTLVKYFIPKRMYPKKTNPQ